MIAVGGVAWVCAAGPSFAQSGAVSTAHPTATDVRLAGDGNETRLVVDLSRKVDVRAFTLANPYRVVLDLPQVNFQFRAKAGEQSRGLIKAFRFGLVMSGGSRIVIDAARPVRIERAHVVDAAGDQPARLVLDLKATDRAAFLRTIALDNRSRPPPAARTPDNGRPDDDPRPVVVIDPGHGGIDSGTQAATGELEKTIVLDFALLLREKIEATGKFRVAMTRSDDTFVPLGERVRFARAKGAQLFLSIHSDALAGGEGDAQGASIYTLSDTASDTEAARLADAENKADVIAGVDLASEPEDIADILLDLAQREARAFSVQFAKTLVNELKPTVRLHKKPLKSAGFRVLRSPDVPSVLVELGYVSNRRDLKLMTSNQWRTRAADSVVHAVESYFAPRIAGTPARGRRQ